jgi:transposase
MVEQALDAIQLINRVGHDLLLGRIFDEIGFNLIDDPLFRHLVIARVAFPKSKLKTTEYLYRYKQIRLSEDQVYRYLDKLYHGQKELVQQISFEHTLRVLDGRINVVFYDVTTLYFEIDREDELRKTGFSKDGRHQSPQVVLGLLVSAGGYPLAYDIFQGNKFEGHTMLPVIEAFKAKYKLGQLVVVADSGLMSKENIDQLRAKGHEFILGARLKTLKEVDRAKIFGLRLQNGESAVLEIAGLQLVITYSDERAKKDRHNRDKGLEKLRKQIRAGRLTKSNINNKGYNKFLRLEGEIKVAIDEAKLELDARWDGLKGYLTNTKLDKEQVVENYRQLWKIEKAFRVAKSDLKVRPIFHRLQRRIEAHICISFAAYKVFKELERQLHIMKAGISPNRAIEIADNIYEIHAQMPNNRMVVKRVLILTDEQRQLATLFRFGC